MPSFNKIHDAGLPKLTGRELQVLKLIASGETNPQIASELNLSSLTVKTHRQNMLRKLEAANTAQLIVKAAAAGLL